MPVKHLSSITRRLKHTALALLFVGTQIVFPLSLSGIANAANPSGNLDQCRNGTLASPDHCNDSNSPLGWQNGNATATQAHWREGDSIPYRIAFSALTTTSHTIVINWDTTKGGAHAIDYLTTYNRTEPLTDPCENGSVCTGSPTTFPIPTDPQVTGAGVTQISGNFAMWGGTITAVSSYSYPNGTGFSGDKSASLAITFTASTATPVLAWSGHIASQIDWGQNNSASAVSGSPYHTYLGNLDGASIGNQDQKLDAGAVFPTPTLTTQTSSPTVYVGGSITDTASLSGPNSPLAGTVTFYICGPSASAPNCTIGGTQVGTTKTVSPGTGTSGTATSDSYAVTAAGTYCFRANYIPASSSPYSPINETNQVLQAPNNECFVATIAPSTITIIKDAQPNSSQAFSYTTSGGLSTDQSGFTLVDSGSGTTNTHTFSNVAPGTYTVTEQSQSGWDFKGLNCGNNSSAVINGETVTITITGGQSVSCTYTNAERGTLTVYKVTDPANDTTGFPVTASTSNGNINGNASQTVTTSTPVVYDVSQGTYNVSEDLSNTPGWAQVSNMCTSVVVSANNLSPTCTITNQKLAKLKIVKSTNPSSSSQSFSFSASGSSITQVNNAFVLDTNNNDATYPNNYQYVNLTPGTYSVTEQSTSGWQLTGLACTGISYSWPGNTATLSLNLPAGADVTCTYTNTQFASITGTKYEVNADSSIVGPLQNWTIYLLVNGNVVNQTTTAADGSYSFSNLLPGSYSLAEQTQNGWTQIYPFGNSIGISLTAGNNSTANNFGNFHNAQISGFKFNDINGNGVWDNGEPGLSGWVITLYDNGGSGATLNHQVSQTTTATGGSYTITNLPPTTYKVCETAQTGWTQTYPDNTGCQTVDVTLSGHNYSNTNFGNQGRGTITVIKNVNDGFGNVTQNVTTWTWGYSGTNGSGSNIATGSGNSQAVAAGSYTVSENQKSGYHVTASTCDNQSNSNISTSKSVTVNPGNNVVCTFTNTRDTGTITVNKTLVPSNDTGLFNLNISGTAYATDVGNNGTTHAVSVVTGTYSVSETAGTNTNLSDYSSTYACTDNSSEVASGTGTSVSGLSVAYGDDVVCTFTNTRLATLTVVKDANPNGSQTFNFHYGSVVTNPSQLINLVADTAFSLKDDGTGIGNSKQVNDLNPGTYYVSEDTVSNWDLTNIQCTGVSFTVDPNNSAKISFTLSPGAIVTCTYTNTERGSIHGTKTIVNRDGSTANSQTGISGVMINLYRGSSATGTPFDTATTDGNGNYSFGSLVPGTYTVSEVVPTGYTQIFGGGTFTISPGQDVTANNTVDFGNFRNGSISGYKFNDLNGNGTYDQGEPKLSGWTIDLYTGSSVNQANFYDSKVTDSNGNYSFTDLPPNNYYVCEVGQSGWTQTSTPTCYSIDINQSGESDVAVFGNQGRGSITVIKNVANYVNGQWVTTTNASGWTWDLTGTYYSNAGNSAGSSNTLSNLPADTYIIHEDQQTNYHFSSVACTDNGSPINASPAETTSVTLGPGSNIVCTYTNTRDTGTVEVNKTIDPSKDGGLFNLIISGATSYTKNDQTNGGSTGVQTVVTGRYTVSETAGTNTNMNDYTSSYECSNGVSGSGTTTPSFNVASGDNVVCTFTNTRLATLTIVKHVVDEWPADQSTSYSFDFTGSGSVGDFSLAAEPGNSDQQTFTDLPLGNYTVNETQTNGWSLSDLTCTDSSRQIVNSYQASVNLDAGSNVTCTFTNDKLATITVTKFNDLNLNGTYDNTTQTSGLSIPEPTLPGWDMTLTDLNSQPQTSSTQTTGNNGSTTFNNVLPGFYSLDETMQSGWNFSNTYCPNTEGGLDGPFYIDIPAGYNIDCFVGNYQNPALQITKSNNRPNPITLSTNPLNNIVTYTIVVTVPSNSGAVFNTTVTDLPPANFKYVPGSWTALVLHSNGTTTNLKTDGTTTEPTYGSPGIWNLGSLVPGDVITLTYQTIISQSVSNGIYPDSAFVSGYSQPHNGGSQVLGNITNLQNASSTPFVGTSVQIVSTIPPQSFTAGQVLGAEVLVNTGTSLFWLEFALPFLLIGGVVIAKQTMAEPKGDD